MTTALAAAPAFVGARLIDSITQIDTDDKAQSLLDAGVDGVFQYLGSTTTPAIVDVIVRNGLAFCPITYANRFDGPSAVREAQALALPKETTVWLDVESVPGAISPAQLEGLIDSWALALERAGFIPGMYVGPGSLLTSAELYARKVVRYFKAAALIVDRNGAFAEPRCGWCMIQLFPSLNVGTSPPVWSDLDVALQDFRGRLPTWVVAAGSTPGASP
jgi:hypothetical protein